MGKTDYFIVDNMLTLEYAISEDFQKEESGDGKSFRK
jgi:hypothetical protein